jgi:pimeloyl-ACP methyl ester carboxylesterase
MMIVLVNGNPETPAVWDLLVPRLLEAGWPEPIRLAPPGFGGPVPKDFNAEAAAYFMWLVGELEQLAEPVDLVGHDVGGGLVVPVAMWRPELIRSWASDTVGTFDPEYEWHALAQIWQTPGAGERWIADQLALTAEQRAAGLTALGLEPGIAAKLGSAFDAAMGDCILRLYRSSAHTRAALGADLELAAARPGLALVASEDHFVGTDEQRVRSARRAGATVKRLEGCGHWWMTEDDGRRGAAALIEFWTALAGQRD